MNFLPLIPQTAEQFSFFSVELQVGYACNCTVCSFHFARSATININW